MSCACEGQNPANLREVVKCVEPTLFHQVTRPASLGDDTVTPADQLDYRNVLLVYAANGHAYLYSSDGVPTFISYLPTNTEKLEQAINALQETIAELQSDLAEETLNRKDADLELGTEIEHEAARREQADAALSADLTQATTDLKELIDSVDATVADNTAVINTLQSANVQKDTAVSGDTSTVTITKTIGELGSDGTETAMALPVADGEQAGVMNTATYNAVQANSENIDSILNGAVLIENLPASPTQAQLTTAWETATGKTTLINRASIYDKTNGKIWYYYTNVNEWEPADIQNPEITVSQATNETLGIVKGSTEDGQVAVEADGSMSLNGYDDLKSTVDNIDVPKTPKYTVGDTHPSLIFQDSTMNASSANGARGFSFNAYDTQTGTTTYTSYRMPTATSSRLGWMSAPDKSKLDSLLEIKSLNDSLELDENGQLSVVGGGSDVNLLSSYTATSELGDNDAYNASYVNGRLDGSNIIIGRNAQALGGNFLNVAIGNEAIAGRNGTSGGTAIGNKASAAYSHAIAIGEGATVTASQGISIGDNAKGNGITIGYHQTTSNSTNASGIAIGTNASANQIHSVAIGDYATVNRPSEVSIGSLTQTGSNATRFLANVRAGALDTDAVNLKQMQDYVAENAGSSFEVATAEEITAAWEAA